MNKSLNTLFIFNIVFVSAFYLFNPLYSIFAEGIVKDVFSVSITVSALLFSSTFFTLLISKIGDRVKEKEYLLLGGYAVRCISWISYIFVGNLISLIIVQILLGLGEALGTSSFNAIFAEHLDENKHIKEYANYHILSTVVGAVSTLIGGAIVEGFGFRVLFAIMSVLALISFFGILSKPRDLL